LRPVCTPASRERTDHSLCIALARYEAIGMRIEKFAGIEITAAASRE
jgi:hypothetical protein